MDKKNKIYENVNFPIIAFQRKELSGTTNNIFVDTSSIPSSDGKWKASSIAIADDSGHLFETLIRPYFEIHETWLFRKVSKSRLFETGMEINTAIKIIKYYISNKNVIAWHMNGEKELMPNVLALAKTTHCAMKRFDPYRGVYNFSKGNYHYTKLHHALKLIGERFEGRGHHDDIEDVKALKKIWDWMNKNPIRTPFAERIYE